VPFRLLAVRLTVHVPAVVNICTGFCCVEVDPSPKFQDQSVALPDWSVN